MDPITTLVSCYKLYDSIKERLDTIESNRVQFDLLQQQVAEIAEAIDRLKKLHAKNQLPCTGKALDGLHRTLEKVQEFVQQKRFSKEKKSSASSALHLVAELYHGADDKEQFAQFDIMISRSLQSLNFDVSVKILDYAMAATKDAARTAESTAAIQLTLIDSSKLTLNANSASSKIGYGSFSTVYTGTYKKEYVAIKVIHQVETFTARDLKLITKEAMIMQFADHPNILKLKGVSLAKGQLVMELALCSLADYLHRANDFARERCQSLRAAVPTPSLQWKLGIVRDVADAIRYLHSFSILHRDIKSANVLLFYDRATGKTTAKVGDFGLALAVELVSRTAGTMKTARTLSNQGSQPPRAAGTPHYMAPELFDRLPGESIAYSEASDVYSLGVLANEVLTEKVPWEADAREMDVMKWVLTDRLRPQLYSGEGSSTEAAALLRAIGDSDAINSCWNQRPSQRCAAEDVFQSLVIAASTSSAAQEPPVAVAQVATPARNGAVAPPSPPPPPPPPLSTSAKTSDKASSSAYTRITTVDDAETAPLVAVFTAELQAAFPAIFPERTEGYAFALFSETIYDVARLLKHAKALNGGGRTACDKWFQKVGIHPFDAADILDESASTRTAAATPTNDPRLNAAKAMQVCADHGPPALAAWLKENVPDVALPHKRQHIAEVLCANNITCVHRLKKLAGKEDAASWLVSMQIDKLDAEDVCAKITALHKSEEAPRVVRLQPAVQISLPLALYDLDDFITLLAADLKLLLLDMTDLAARHYSEALFAGGIYTTQRFLNQLSLRGKKTAWLKSLGWSQFDVADMLDTVEYEGDQPKLKAVSTIARAEIHGVSPLVQWLTVHLPSLKIASKRQQYADALVANNVSTVHRLIVRGNSEAWLVDIGFDKLDAADCAAVLKPLAEQDVWAAARAKKTAAAAALVAQEAARRSAERNRAYEECALVRAA